MALQLDRTELDEFCPQLFRTLDALALLPRRLGWKRDASGKLQRIAPTEFEKYPRLLFGSIQRYNDVKAGFKEWESRVLRDVESSTLRETRYPELELLCQWMVQHKSVFTKKLNMQHLRTSLYARVFQYLYPRRVLANAYCEKNKYQIDVVNKFEGYLKSKTAEEKKTAETELRQLLEASLPNSIEDTVQKLKEAYNRDDWQSIVADVKAILIANAAYYRTILHGEEPAAPLEELEQGTSRAN